MRKSVDNEKAGTGMRAVWREVSLRWGRHLGAVGVFVVLTAVYFAPAVFEGKSVLQGDHIKASGMGGSHAQKFAATAEPGEFSIWSDAMFSGMPYGQGYGIPAPELPSFTLLARPFRWLGWENATMILLAMFCFYVLLAVMKVRWWAAVGGAVAYGLASYNIIVIVAGHVMKAYAIAYMPLVPAGMFLLFREKYLWGGVLFLLGVAFSVGTSHLQITYYLVLLCLFIYGGFVYGAVKRRAFAVLGKATAIMAAGVALAVAPNAVGLYTNWDLAQHSIRGPSELTPLPDASGKVEKRSTGLDKDYAFQWSYGRMELLNLLIPNAYGGESGGKLGTSSALYQELKRHGAQVGREVQTYTYWGDKPFTSGPMYMGAVVCFLFVVGMFVVRNGMKWWLFGASVFLTLLALGRNFDSFNDIMFHYLPLYNKFRTVEMSLVVPGLVLPLIGFWGLQRIVAGEVDEKLLKKALSWAAGIVGGLCLLVWIAPSFLLDFRSPYDAQFQSQVPDWYYNALLADRASLASDDALRSLLFVLAAAGLLFLFLKTKRKEHYATGICAAFAVLMLADLWTIDRRYLNDSHYVRENAVESYKESVADKEIFKDTDPSFRVLGLDNPWQDTNVSYFHHSVGGYHAVKLRRYQDLIDRYMGEEHLNIVKTLQQTQSLEAVMPVLAASPCLNMLNTRYIIYNPGQPPIHNPFAYGNCWFVDDYRMVENADAEIAAFDGLQPLHTAVIDERFSEHLEGFVPQKDSLAVIALENYRPSRLIYRSRSATEQLAVFSEIYYAGWQVKIDGEEAPCFRADWILRALRVPAGEHTITFEFVPTGYVLAANVGAYGAFLILLLFVGAAACSLVGVYRRAR